MAFDTKKAVEPHLNIKIFEHARRQQSTQVAGELKLESTWTPSQITIPELKWQLLRLVETVATTDPAWRPATHDHKIVVAFGDDSDPVMLASQEKQSCPNLKSNHSEGDSLVFYHVEEAFKRHQGASTRFRPAISSEDTDVVHIGLLLSDRPALSNARIDLGKRGILILSEVKRSIETKLRALGIVSLGTTKVVTIALLAGCSDYNEGFRCFSMKKVLGTYLDPRLIKWIEGKEGLVSWTGNYLNVNVDAAARSSVCMCLRVCFRVFRDAILIFVYVRLIGAMYRQTYPGQFPPDDDKADPKDPVSTWTTYRVPNRLWLGLRKCMTIVRGMPRTRTPTALHTQRSCGKHVALRTHCVGGQVHTRPN